jgi:hypothetical protein
VTTVDFFKDPTSEFLGLGLGRQAPALVVAEPKPLVPQLLTQDAVLFLEVLDGIALLLAEPTSDRDQRKSKRINARTHWARITADGLSTNPLST